MMKIVNLRKKRYLILIFAIFLSIAFYKFFEYQTSRNYKDLTLPFYAQNKTTNKIHYFIYPKEIAQSMLAGEEYFKGSLNVRAIDHDRAELTLHNEITGDDTKEAIEYYVIAERKQPGWEITQFKIHWKCNRGLYWPNFWTTSGCI